MDTLKGDETFEKFSLDYNGILEYQLNRYPYLFLDFVEEVIPGKSAKGYKNYTANEWFFPVHYPGQPSVPGLLQVEALSHLAILTFLTLPGNKAKITNSLEVNNIKFIKRVVPGDRLDMQAQLHSWKRGIAKCSTQGYIKDILVCQADFIFTIPEILEKYKPREKK